MQLFTLFGGVRDTIGHALRNGFWGLLIGAGLIEGLAAFLNKESITSVQSLITMPSYTIFVHVTAALFGVTLSVLCIVWTAAMRTVKGTIHGADQLVDTVDGPNRHGLF
jgi:hypothetical protein